MRNFILSLIATIVVMIVSPPNPNIIADSPHFIETTKLITPLEPVAYAQKQEMVKVPVATPKPVTTAPTSVSGDWVAQCHAWASMAGITLDNSAIKLLERESHCSPVSRNPTSSAGGIPQALPWTKMGCPLSVEGAPCQLKWFQGYVLGRYGSYVNALGHSLSKGWY